MSLRFYNTASRHIEGFVPREPGKVALYTCGPTVYDRLHVGNWASYIRWDVLVRLLRVSGLEVTRVMNITDVGHLVGDGDDGQDKLEKGAQRDREAGSGNTRSAWDVAHYYTEDFYDGMAALGNLAPDHYARATDYIPQQLALVRTLKQKGYVYQIDDGLYFDTAKFPRYGDFAHLDLADLRAGARVAYNPQKRNVSDFALWKFSPDGEARDMEWDIPADLLDAPTEGSAPDQPARKGFPGWHLECSAIALSLLGDTLDIHTGGIDHIPVHHTNEIAQSEAATGVTFADFWLHANFLTVDGTKISKSLGNGYTLDDLRGRGFSPADLRMLVLQSHYRTEANFTFEALDAARARLRHWRNAASLRWQTKAVATDAAIPSRAARGALVETLGDDLDTPRALEMIDGLISDVERTPLTDVSGDALEEFFRTADALLGLDLLGSTPDISDAQKALIVSRERAREAHDYAESDRLRDALAAQGIGLRDVPGDTVWYRP